MQPSLSASLWAAADKKHSQLCISWRIKFMHDSISLWQAGYYEKSVQHLRRKIRQLHPFSDDTKDLSALNNELGVSWAWTPFAALLNMWDNERVGWGYEPLSSCTWLWLRCCCQWWKSLISKQTLSTVWGNVLRWKAKKWSTTLDFQNLIVSQMLHF